MDMKFSEDEMRVRYVIPGARGRIDLPVYEAPVTAGENMLRAIFDKAPVFMPNYRYFLGFNPRIFPDAEARASIRDGGEPKVHPEGFPDMFGITWVFVEVAGGSMVKPGAPLLSTMNEWKEKVVWPDIDSWDWEGQKALSREFVADPELAVMPTIYTGYFERMISMMDFEGAAMALIDEDQQKAVHEFLDKLADLYCRMIDKFVEHFSIRGICVHDDWGSQRSPFFSLETARNIFVPHLRTVVDHAHAKGLFYDMHSCGHIESIFPAIVEAGVDSWAGQEMNDKAAMYREYGKDILIGVETPDISEDMPRDEVRRVAKEYVDAYMVPGAPAMVGYSSKILNPCFFEDIYRFSRQKENG